MLRYKLRSQIWTVFGKTEEMRLGRVHVQNNQGLPPFRYIERITPAKGKPGYSYGHLASILKENLTPQSEDVCPTCGGPRFAVHEHYDPKKPWNPSEYSPPGELCGHCMSKFPHT